MRLNTLVKISPTFNLKIITGIVDAYICRMHGRNFFGKKSAMTGAGKIVSDTPTAQYTSVSIHKAKPYNSIERRKLDARTEYLCTIKLKLS